MHHSDDESYSRDNPCKKDHKRPSARPRAKHKTVSAIDTPNGILMDCGSSSDTSALEKIIDEVLAANPRQLEQYRAGKTTMIGFFVGQVMKASKGQANPQLVNELLTRKLG